MDSLTEALSTRTNSHQLLRSTATNQLENVQLHSGLVSDWFRTVCEWLGLVPDWFQTSWHKIHNAKLLKGLNFESRLVLDY